MVVASTQDTGSETIYGMYPTRKLAEARVSYLMGNSDYCTDENDFCASVVEVTVGEEGADLDIQMR